MTSVANEVRDPAKPREYYDKYIAEKKASIEHALSLKAANLFRSIAQRCFQIAAAAYSGGYPAKEGIHWFNESTSYELRFLDEAYHYKLGGLGTIDEYAERFAAAHLARREEELIAAHRKCEYTETPDPHQLALIDQLCRTLEGKPVKYDTALAKALTASSKEWGLMPKLFAAVGDRDAAAFASELERYLVDGWAPPIEKMVKRDLKDPTPRYCGKYCYLSIALCNIVGQVPELGKKASQYLPVDLFSPR